MRVRVLTNSYLANDVSAVHAGYSAYREDLLRAGVELEELKPGASAELEREGKQRHTGSSGSALHAKTYMADARTPLRRLLQPGSALGEAEHRNGAW